MSPAVLLILAVVTWALLGAMAVLDYRQARRERWGLASALAAGAIVGAAIGLALVWALAAALGLL